MFDFLAHLSETPASWIDKAYLEEPANLFSKFTWFFKVRFYSLVLNVAQVLSATASLLMALFYMVRVLFTSDETQSKRLESLRYYASLFSKNLFGFAASVLTLFMLNLFLPQNYSLLFLPERKVKGISNGGKDIKDENVEIKQPSSKEELAKIIKEANEKGYKVMPLGGGRSQGLQFIPAQNGEKRIVIDMSEFDSIEIDSVSKTATVGAGCIWSHIQDKANEHKLALCSAQASLSIFTVGGSIGIDAHGWDIKNGMVSKTIESMTIVTPTGEINEITPDSDDFKYINGGLGLMGIVVAAKIRLTDNIKVKRTTCDVKPQAFHDYFQQLRADGKTELSLARLELGANPLSNIFMENYESIEDKKTYKAENFKMEALQGNRLDRILIAFLRTFSWVRSYYWKSDRAEFRKEEVVMTRNEAMYFGIRSLYNHSESQAEWLQEYFIPCEYIGSFLKELGDLLKKHDVPLINATIRYVPQKDAAMSYAPTGDRYAVVICFNQKLHAKAIRETSKWQRQAHAITSKYGGSVYLAYQNNLSFEDFKASYPNYQDAIAYKKQVDPKNVLASGFYDKYFDEITREEPTRSVMQSTDARESFKGFLNHVLYRIKPEEIYPLLDDILTYCDTQEEIYKELCKRLPEVSPNFLVDIWRALTSLKAIKHDLGRQAVELLELQGVKKIEGVLEIGSPARYIEDYRKGGIEVQGTIYANDDKETLMSKFPKKAYHQFLALDFNKEPNYGAIQDSTLELVTCYAGLHHFNSQNLTTFIKEMKRVLKPGGKFLLVDHDISKDVVNHQAHLAHLIFNAVNGVSLRDELAEVRDFHPITYWQNEMTKNGFQLGEHPNKEMIRDKDPTRNRMLCFFKEEENQENSMQGQSATI